MIEFDLRNSSLREVNQHLHRIDETEFVFQYLRVSAVNMNDAGLNAELIRGTGSISLTNV